MQVESTVEKGMREALKTYNNNTVMKDQMDFIQSQVHITSMILIQKRQEFIWFYIRSTMLA